MFLPPWLHIGRVKALTVVRIARFPSPLLHSFALLPACRSPTAFLSFSNSWIRFKKLTARNTLLPLEQWIVIHKRSLVGRRKKNEVRLNPVKSISQSRKKLSKPTQPDTAPTSAQIGAFLIVPYSHQNLLKS
jgi:hypothetical protein